MGNEQNSAKKFDSYLPLRMVKALEYLFFVEDTR